MHRDAEAHFSCFSSWFSVCFCSRDEVKSKWSISDFIRAFIKFHGHVYLSKSLDKLDGLREKLEEQFQVGPQGRMCMRGRGISESFLWKSCVCRG